jgi:polysaccharide pyruvyl transferase CsaB
MSAHFAPVVLAGYYGFGNLGDEMLAELLVTRLPSVRWIVLSGDPRKTAGTLGCAAEDRWNFFRVAAALRKSRAIVLGGGELFQTRTSVRSLLYYVGLLFLARLSGCRVFAFGIALDPGLPNFWTGWIRRALGKHPALWVRDSASAQRLAHPDRENRAAVIPDPVWAWDVPSPPRTSSSFRRILWFPRFPEDGMTTARWSEILNEACSDPAWEHGFLLFHPSEDGPALARLRGRLTFFHRLERWSRPDDLWRVLSAYDAVVTMRFHGLILSEMARRPWVAVAAHQKVADLADQLGGKPLRPESISSATLVSALTESRDRLHRNNSEETDRRKTRVAQALADLDRRMNRQSEPSSTVPILIE